MVWAGAPRVEDDDWVDGTQVTIEGTAFRADAMDTPYCRMPAADQGKIPGAVWGMSHHSTGVNVRFVPNGRKIVLKWVVDDPYAVDAFLGPTGMTGLDVYKQLPKEGEATFDFCHPNDWGAMQMGRVYAAAIRRALGEDK